MNFLMTDPSKDVKGKNNLMETTSKTANSIVIVYGASQIAPAIKNYIRYYKKGIFIQSVASQNNPDHVSIVIHNYPGPGFDAGDSKYDDLERRLAAAHIINVPSIPWKVMPMVHRTRVTHSHRKKFSGKYSHHVIRGGVGDNLPQEAPKAFADSIIEVDGYSK